MRVLAGPVLLALVMFNCGGSPTGPGGGSTTTTTATPPPGIRVVAIVGNSLLRAVGESTRLIAVATYADNTSKDVTAEATWTSANTSLFSVSGGVVTAVGYGVAEIRANVGGRIGGFQMAATPAGTFIFLGRAREPGHSGLPFVRVLETASNRSATTDANGSFHIAALASARSFKFDRDGYENTEVIPEMTAGPLISVESAMQPVIRLTAGQTSGSLFVAPHDVSYVIGSDPCYPCKLIRVTAPSGRLRLTLTSQTQLAGLQIWINGVRLTPAGSPLTVEAQVSAGEVPVYVGHNLPLNSGGATDYRSFTLATSMVGS